MPQIQPRDRVAPYVDGRAASYPSIFGWGPRTAVLMFIAARPGCRSSDITDYFGLQRGKLVTNIRELRKEHLIRGKYRYSLNKGLAHFAELCTFLRILAQHYGIETSTDGYARLNTKRASVSQPADIPRNLFCTDGRTSVLLMVAAVSQVFAREMDLVLGADRSDLSRRLRDLQRQEILEGRVFGRHTLYALNPAYPGAQKLYVFLRKVLRSRHDICQTAHALLVLRYQRRFRAPEVSLELHDALNSVRPLRSVFQIKRHIHGIIGSNFPPLRPHRIRNRRYKGPQRRHPWSPQSGEKRLVANLKLTAAEYATSLQSEHLGSCEGKV